MPRSKKSEPVQVKVRMPDDLRRSIEKAADKSGLTINAEILKRLEASQWQHDVLSILSGNEENGRMLAALGMAIRLKAWTKNPHEAEILRLAAGRIVAGFAGIDPDRKPATVDQEAAKAMLKEPSPETDARALAGVLLNQFLETGETK